MTKVPGLISTLVGVAALALAPLAAAEEFELNKGYAGSILACEHVEDAEAIVKAEETQDMAAALQVYQEGPCNVVQARFTIKSVVSVHKISDARTVRVVAAQAVLEDGTVVPFFALTDRAPKEDVAAPKPGQAV